jgi:chaperonin GroEL
MNYQPKNLSFDDKARERLVSGISQIAKAVKSTLGPRGRTVLIESNDIVNGITVTKDGVTVARSIDLLDPVENLAVRMVREAADRTALSSGDGTTTAIVLTEAIVKEGLRLIEPHHNVTEVIRAINKKAEEVIESLDQQSIKVNQKKLQDVATISANNDEEIGKVIADTYKKVGLKNGVVTVEKSQTSDTTSEVTHGIQLDRGYTSPLFVNDQRRDECILEDVHVLVTDQEISNLISIENVLKQIINEQKKLLIIGTCSQNVINTLAANVVRNGLKFCNIIPPDFGYRKHELMGDIALALGATYLSEQTGDNIQFANYGDLGHAEKVIVGRDKTIIIRNEEYNDEIKQRVEELEVQREEAPKKQDKDFISKRIAGLQGAIGVIYVGGNSDLEQKELYDRVDDAVCAVKSALEEGILPGGGVFLFNSSYYVGSEKETEEEKVATLVMKMSLLSPFNQIMSNAGINPDDVHGKLKTLARDAKEDESMRRQGYDVKNHQYGDMIEMGVVDPAKVTKNALRNAVSVATTILSTNAIITLARTYESGE